MSVVIGDRFGRLTALGREQRQGENEKQKFWWVHVKCDCGKEKWVRETNLMIGHAKSCGCLAVDNMRRVATTHGQSRTPLYRTWVSIKDRCRPIETGQRTWYPDIHIHAPWLHDFEVFAAYVNEHLGPRPRGQSIDRIDNTGDYMPGNIRWATDKEQARNRRSSRLLTINGEARCLAEWAEKYKLPESTISNRLSRGWSEEDAVKTPSLTREGVRPRK
jgi:hypothetical protein